MKKAPNNFQDLFLNNSRKRSILVTIHLINGFQLKGLVKGFDPFTVVLDCDDKQMLIYKHAITTITPIKPILHEYNEEEN